MRELLLNTEGVCYTYEDSSFSLANITLPIYTGERIAVLGGNGAGKSTLFLLCSGILKPDCGTLSYRNRAVGAHNKAALLSLREKVGVVFQDPDRQIIGPTVESEVSFGPMNLKLSRDLAAQRVKQALDVMGLHALRDRPPHSLSGGERKKVTIAGILAMDPEIILLDEPTASLDPSGVENLEQVFATLSLMEKALVVSTHDIDFAWRWADRILVLHEGRLLADASPEAVFSNAALLKKAGLRRPYLYEFALYLQKQRRLPGGCWPKKTEELPRYFTGN